VALRIYESAGKPAHGVAIKLNSKIKGVRETNLLEDDGETIKTDGQYFTVDLGPFEIKTLRMSWAEAPGP
jgi:alpha-mannosidase